MLTDRYVFKEFLVMRCREIRISCVLGGKMLVAPCKSLQIRFYAIKYRLNEEESIATASVAQIESLDALLCTLTTFRSSDWNWDESDGRFNGSTETQPYTCSHIPSSTQRVVWFLSLHSLRENFLCLILIFHHGWERSISLREWNINKIMASFEAYFGHFCLTRINVEKMLTSWSY